MKKASKPAVKAILVILVLIICGIGVLSYFNVIDISSILSPTQKEENNIFLETSTESESQNQNTVKTFDDNDYISIPAEEHIAYDENASMVYYDDQLVVYTFSDFSEEDAKKLADLVGGEIVGDISGDINALQIQVEPTELNDLESMANKLMNVDGVMYAGYNYPIQISPAEAITDPWSEDADNPETDLGDEENPDGNDWWAEAIGAYTAWGYSDQCQPIKVGVVDFGFDTEHEDLKGRISFLTDYALNSAADHGTHVAGIIGANGNNGIGLRGVADTADLICVDLVPTDSISYNHTSTIEMIAINKKLIESGAKVVNNSWGISILSETGFEMWLDPELKKQNPIEAAVIKATGAYDRYMEYRVALSKRTGLESTVMMTQLLMSGKEDFLFVQGAGNGYNYYEDGKEIGQGIGCDTYYSGYFCSVNKEIYELLSKPTKEKLAQNGFGYDDIDRRIIIVGAVENQQNNETGYYKMTNFSNFGENVDVCAPGNNVFSTVASDKKYDNYPGTSMAAPMVTGSAALIWSLKPELSAPEVRDILLKNVKTRAYGVGEGEGCEYPMLNVGAAVKAVMGANENSDSVDLTDYYTEFVKSEGYKADWKKNPYGDEYTVVRYAVVDLDQDGTPELLLSGKMNENKYSCNAIYTINKDTHEIKITEDGIFETYCNPTYSKKYHALVFNKFEATHTEDTDDEIETQAFWEFDGTHLNLIGELVNENKQFTEYIYTSSLSGKVENISAEEWQKLMTEAEAPEWIPLFDVEENHEALPDLTEGYWVGGFYRTDSVFKFNSDGTVTAYTGGYDTQTGKATVYKSNGTSNYYQSYEIDGHILKLIGDKGEVLANLRYVTKKSNVDSYLFCEGELPEDEHCFCDLDVLKYWGSRHTQTFYMQHVDENDVEFVDK